MEVSTSQMGCITLRLQSARSKKPFYRFNTIVGVFSSSKNPKKDPECHQLNTIEGEFSEATHSKKEKKLEKNPKNISTAQHQYTHPL